MSEIAYWTRQPEAAKRELDAATKRTEVNLAASRLMRIKAELERLEQTPIRRASGAAAPAASS
jgi:hypothetical protein